MSVFDILEKSARQWPDKYALKADGIWYSYSHIYEEARDIANILNAYSVIPRDRVFLLCKNSLDYVTAYFGIVKSGAIAVPIHTDMDNSELNYILRECTPKAIIIQPELDHLLQNIKELPLVFYTRANKNRRGDHHAFSEMIENYKNNSMTQNNISAEEIALILYTSGVTGKPKGVRLTHENILANTNSICQYLKLDKSDIIMQVLPFYYSYGKSFLHSMIHVGGSIVINNNFTFPNTVLDEMERESCTGFSGVPSTFSILLNYSRIRDYKFDSLRFVTQAGGHMPKNHIIDLRSILPDNVDLFIMYGQTEATARLAYLEPENILRKLGSIGKAIPGVTLEIRDKEGKICEAWKIGEVWAKGANIMMGYWNNEEESKKIIVDGYLKTGDLGYMDEEGYIFIKGRIKTMIKSAGYRVNSKEIEEVIFECQKVKDVFVTGVPDDILGEAIVAFVVLSELKDINSIRSYCKARLPIYKNPKYIIPLSEIFKKKSGKVDAQRMKKYFDEILRNSGEHMRLENANINT